MCSAEEGSRFFHTNHIFHTKIFGALRAPFSLYNSSSAFTIFSTECCSDLTDCVGFLFQKHILSKSTFSCFLQNDFYMLRGGTSVIELHKITEWTFAGPLRFQHTEKLHFQSCGEYEMEELEFHAKNSVALSLFLRSIILCLTASFFWLKIRYL